MGGHLVEESLVQWKNLSIDDATWEPTEQLLATFSHTILEDKDRLLGGSNVRPRRSIHGFEPNPKYFWVCMSHADSKDVHEGKRACGRAVRRRALCMRAIQEWIMEWVSYNYMCYLLNVFLLVRVFYIILYFVGFYVRGLLSGFAI